MASPERTCVGCRVKAPKAELLRVVRLAGGEVAVDPTGFGAGTRGITFTGMWGAWRPRFGAGRSRERSGRA